MTGSINIDIGEVIYSQIVLPVHCDLVPLKFAFKLGKGICHRRDFRLEKLSR